MGKRTRDDDPDELDDGDFRMDIGPDGAVTFVGRPPWSSGAKKIKVNQDEQHGPTEDRRHMLHWDEQLKPVIDSVMSSLFAKYRDDKALTDILRAPLKGRIKRIQGTAPRDIAERVAKEMNGAKINLVPDRADINKAIEHVRERVRRLTRQLTDDRELTGKVGQAMSSPYPNDAVMELYLEAASQTLLGNTSADTAIKLQIQEICFQILGLVQSCHAPCNFIILLHQVTESVTFDLSEKALRDNTSRTLAWFGLMERNRGAPPEDRYKAMLTLLD